jgi:hypothetical protein
MFRLLFGKTDEITAQPTQRARIASALDEINEIVAGLEVKPKFCFEAGTGRVWIDLPDQMPDEAPALPAPDAETEVKVRSAA